MEYYIYNHDYIREPYNEDNQPSFPNLSEAYRYILEEMTHFDTPFMIGDDEKIYAIVFQGAIYT